MHHIVEWPSGHCHHTQEESVYTNDTKHVCIHQGRRRILLVPGGSGGFVWLHSHLLLRRRGRSAASRVVLCCCSAVVVARTGTMEAHSIQTTPRTKRTATGTYGGVVHSEEANTILDESSVMVGADPMPSAWKSVISTRKGKAKVCSTVCCFGCSVLSLGLAFLFFWFIGAFLHWYIINNAVVTSSKSVGYTDWQSDHYKGAPLRTMVCEWAIAASLHLIGRQCYITYNLTNSDQFLQGALPEVTEVCSSPSMNIRCEMCF